MAFGVNATRSSISRFPQNARTFEMTFCSHEILGLVVRTMMPKLERLPECLWTILGRSNQRLRLVLERQVLVKN